MKRLADFDPDAPALFVGELSPAVIRQEMPD